MAPQLNYAVLGYLVWMIFRITVSNRNNNPVPRAAVSLAVSFGRFLKPIVLCLCWVLVCLFEVLVFLVVYLAKVVRHNRGTSFDTTILVCHWVLAAVSWPNGRYSTAESLLLACLVISTLVYLASLGFWIHQCYLLGLTGKQKPPIRNRLLNDGVQMIGLAFCPVSFCTNIWLLDAGKGGKSAIGGLFLDLFAFVGLAIANGKAKGYWNPESRNYGNPEIPYFG